jgi:ADP-ribose pyrophosphatase YjhB (NUDIX family)
MIDIINTNLILSEINPKEGIGDELLDFVLKLVPYIGIELFIINDYDELLLSYRNDNNYKGWHFIGGMLRWRESWEERLRKTVLDEIGVDLEFEESPFFIKENYDKELDPRGHSVNLLFRSNISPENANKLKLWNKESEPMHGELNWFSREPENIIKMHRNYFKLINKRI